MTIGRSDLTTEFLFLSELKRDVHSKNCFHYYPILAIFVVKGQV